MATDIAIAAVTLAIRQTIQAEINQSLDLSAEVISDSPDKMSGISGSTVNVYLYQGQINPFLRSDDLTPDLVTDTKTGKSVLTRHWVTPLILHYLISFYGDERLLVPQRLMAVSTAALHRQPNVSAKDLCTLANTQFPDAQKSTEDDFESVQIFMQTMTVGEVHKMWSALKAPYALSMLYEARTSLVQSQPVSTEVDLVKDLDVDAINKRPAPNVEIED